MRRSILDRVVLLIARGFGSGLLRPAPGTWGSLVGFAYFAALLPLPRLAACGIALAVMSLSIWTAGRAARLLGKKDPGEIVIDEIAAIPLACWPLAGVEDPPVWLWVAVFVAWRVADVLKPPPARQLERLPGGWGIVADDLMSAAYVGVIFWAALRLGAG